jgi:hypothetical protein
LTQLRQLEKRFDDQIKATVQLLADTRRELKAAHFTEFPKDTRPVQFDELLRFAKNISKFTVHPSAALSQKPRITEGDDGSGIAPSATANTPAVKVALSTAEGTPAPTQGTTSFNSQVEKEVGIGWETLTEEHKGWLDHFARAPFVPWPNDDKIRAGALSSIQAQAELGQDIRQLEQAPAVTTQQPAQSAEANIVMEDDVEHGNSVPLPAPASAVERPRAPRAEFTGFDF